MYNILLYIVLFLSFPPVLQSESRNTDEQLIEAVTSLLQNRYPHRQNNLQVRLVRTGGDINLENTFEVLLPATNKIPRALQRIEVRHADQNKNGWALVYVAHFDSVLAANRPLKNDEQIDIHDLDVLWTETTRFHGEPLKPAMMRKMFARGLVFASRYVAGDKILKERDLRNAFDITTGQSVTMLYQQRGVKLSFTCKSRNQGFIGDLIKLYSPDTQLMYKAKIIRPGVASWVETLE